MGKSAASLSHHEPGGEGPAPKNRKSTQQVHAGRGWGAEGGSAPRRRPSSACFCVGRLSSPWWPDSCSRSMVMMWREEGARSVTSRRSLPRAEEPSAALPTTLGSADDQSCPRQGPLLQMPQGWERLEGILNTQQGLKRGRHGCPEGTSAQVLPLCAPSSHLGGPPSLSAPGSEPTTPARPLSLP